MQRSSQDRVLFEWQRRLDVQLRSNLIGDVIAIVLVVPTYLFVYRSGWVIALLATRLMVFGMVYCARRQVDSLNPQRPIILVLAGNLVGAVLATVVIPEFATVAALVVVGDILLLISFVPVQARRPYVAAVTVAAVGIGLLSLQRWTNVGQEAPRWLVISFVAGQSTGISVLLAQTNWSVLSLARRQGVELAASRQRIQHAVDGATRSLAETIASGPRRALGQVGALLRSLDARGVDPESRLASTTEDALATAAEAAAQLRRIAHGLFAADFSSQPLLEALGDVTSADDAHRPSIVCCVGAELTVDVRHALIEIVAEVDARARAAGGCVDALSCMSEGLDVVLTARLRVDLPDAALTDAQLRLDDLAGAAGGEARLECRRGHTAVRCWLPTRQPTEPRAQVLPSLTSARLGSGDGAAALGPYVRGALAVSSAGLLVIAAACVVYRSRHLLYVAGIDAMVVGTLALAVRELHHGRSVPAVLLATVETTFAACSVTALVPTLAPVLAIATVVPLIVAPTVVGLRRYILLAVAQQLTITLLVVAYVIHPSSEITGLLPAWLEAGVLVASSIAVVALIVQVQRATAAAIDADNARLRESRTRAVVAARQRRQALERDLHDGAQQAVVALAVRLRVLLRQIGQDVPRAVTSVPEIIALVDDADTVLAEFSEGSYPAVLVEGGLAGALERMAAANPYPTRVVADVPRTLPAAVEMAAFYCCSEAMQNILKHAGSGATARVEVRHAANVLRFEVADTGCGFDLARVAGRGLANLAARVEGLLGEVEVSSSPGRGSVVRGWIPTGAVESGDVVAATSRSRRARGAPPAPVGSSLGC